MALTPDDVATFDEIILDKIQVGARAAFSDRFIRDVVMHRERDESLRVMEYVFSNYVVGNTISKKETFERRSLTWWDAFKQAYFPRWFRRRFPVREETIVVSCTWIHVCPHINASDDRSHVEFLMRPDQLMRRNN